jgi:type IV pilus biogenesis protein CpaD/CtpE
MKVLTRVLMVTVLAAGAGCGERPQVVQGVVLSYDAAANVVVVKDEIPPNPDVLFALAGADIGATPAPGDEVRLAYLVVGSERRALRMMNLTRQAELGRKGGVH